MAGAPPLSLAFGSLARTWAACQLPGGDCQKARGTSRSRAALTAIEQLEQVGAFRRRPATPVTVCSSQPKCWRLSIVRSATSPSCTD